MSKENGYRTPYSDTVPIAQGTYNQPTDHVNIYIDGEDSPFPWKWSGMVCSILSMLCCCCPIGLVATFFAGKAFVSHGLSQFKKARKEMQLAKKLGLTALILGIIFAIIYAVLEFILITTLKEELHESMGKSG